MRLHYPADLERQLKRFKNPEDIQTFLHRMPYNSGDETRSALGCFRHRAGHCFEGALFAAMALEYLGHRPLVMDLRGHGDDDHVVALFRQNGKWGAVSKTNTTLLDYRPPFFRDPRELAMSYWAMYFNWKGKYAMKDFGGPIDLRKVPGKEDWRFGEDDMADFGMRLDRFPHHKIISAGALEKLRKVPERLRQACFVGSDLKGVRKS